MKDIRPVNPSIYPSPNPCGIKIPFYIKERKNMEPYKSCLNCDHSYTICGELICRWHEGYENAGLTVDAPKSAVDYVVQAIQSLK